MRLKNAVALAKRKGLKWVAVDEDERIWGYKKKPVIFLVDWIPEGHDKFDYFLIGMYTGSTEWNKTLKEVV